MTDDIHTAHTESQELRRGLLDFAQIRYVVRGLYVREARAVIEIPLSYNPMG